MTGLSLLLLGGFEVRRNGELVTQFRTDKIRALFAYLAVEAERPHRREVLADLLWPEWPERDARRNLTNSFSRLCASLGKKISSRLFTVTRTAIQLNAEHLWLDVRAVQSLIAACESHRHDVLHTCERCITRLRQAVDLYRGGFMAGFTLSDAVAYDEWLLVQRENHHHQLLTLLYNLAAVYEARGDYEAMQAYARQQIQIEPWREPAHRQLMRAYAHSGLYGAALAQYETCRQILQDELGVAPSARTRALYERVKERRLERESKRGTEETPEETRGEVSQANMAVPSSSVMPTPWHTHPGGPLHNLPVQLTSFVGREEELAEITWHLAHPDYRLVSVVGLGGMGKTRLALAAAARQVGLFRDGVWFVSLLGDESADSLIFAIANVLHLVLHNSDRPESHLKAYLRDKEMLLVLDNFASPPEGVDLILDILRNAPHVVFLVTARQRLNVQAEYVVGLEGLTYPPRDVFPTGVLPEISSPSDDQWSAIQLFAERANRSAAQGFVLSAETTPDVVRVCQLVEGMPLAIELAAALVETYPCAEIVRSIRHNLGFLATSMRDIPPQHRSVRAVFESSWRVLPRHEQSILAQISVFRGGFTQDAALAILAPEPAVAEESFPSGAEHCLRALVDKSLLRQTEAGRYEMHELLRQFAAEKLESGDWVPAGGMSVQAAVHHALSTVHSRHSRFYLSFVAERTRRLYGPESQRAVAEIQQEMSNVQEAWEWAVAHDEMKAIEHSLDGLSRYYMLAGPLQEGEGAFSMAVEQVHMLLSQPHHLESEDEQVLLSKLLGEQARFLLHQGQCRQAIRTAWEAIRWAHAVHAVEPEAAGYLHLGHALWRQGDHEAARARLERALALARSAQQTPESAERARQVEGGSLRNLGTVAFLSGDYAGARHYYEQALRVYREMGDRRGESAALNNLGVVSRRLGDCLEARACYEQALHIKREIGDRQGEAFTLNNLGNICLYLGDYAGAQNDYQEALEIKREIGDQRGVGLELCNLALLFHQQGDPEAARAYSQQALAIARDVDNPPLEGSALTHLGHALAALGKLPEAMAAYEKALHLWQALGEFARAMEPRAGLVRVLLAQGELAYAQAHVDEILCHLQTDTMLVGAIDPFQVYLTCYHVLHHGGDARAHQILRMAYHLLHERAAQISDHVLRRSFLENVPAHRDIVAEWSARAQAECQVLVVSRA